MTVRFPGFNLYLLPFLVASALVVGCQTDRNGKEATTLSLHLEVNQAMPGRSERVPVYRKDPVLINVEKEPFLTEANVVRASLNEDVGGFSIQLQFDRQGTWLLEGITTANKGKRIAVLCRFGELRWLAAPLITERIADGRLSFAPDASREEVERIVKGLNNVAKALHKGSAW